MGQIVSDTFTRADAASLGANWTVSTGLTSFSIVSNKGGAPGSDLSVGLNYNGIFTGAGWTGGNDQYAELTISAMDARSDGGALVRGGTTNGDGFLVDINTTDANALGTAMSFDVFEVTGSVFTPVNTGLTGVTVNVGDVLRVEANGTTITGKLNGVTKITNTNNAHPTGTPGIRFWHNQNGSTVQFTLWAAGDFATGTAAHEPDYGRPFPFKPGSPSYGSH